MKIPKVLYIDIMIFRLLFISLIAINISSNEIKEYKARYSYDTEEISIKGIRKLEKINQDYVLSFNARNMLAKMSFTSTFSMENENITTKNYEIKIRPKFIKRDQQISFDYENKLLSSLGRHLWSKDLDIYTKAFDPLNAQIQIRSNLLRGMKEFSIQLVEIKNGEIEENFYSIDSEQVCVNNDKKYNCLVLKRLRKEEGRETLYFVAPELDYMFLKIIDTGPERIQTLELIEILSFG